MKITRAKMLVTASVTALALGATGVVIGFDGPTNKPSSAQPAVPSAPDTGSSEGSSDASAEPAKSTDPSKEQHAARKARKDLQEFAAATTEARDEARKSAHAFAKQMQAVANGPKQGTVSTTPKPGTGVEPGTPGTQEPTDPGTEEPTEPPVEEPGNEEPPEDEFQGATFHFDSAHFTVRNGFLTTFNTGEIREIQLGDRVVFNDGPNAGDFWTVTHKGEKSFSAPGTMPNGLVLFGINPIGGGLSPFVTLTR